jgi:outer membrane biosynthesis protein TonB
MKSDAGLARSYSRRAWLLGSRFQNPFKTPDEMRAYIADPQPRILDADYPAGATRTGVAGTVRLRALVDPRGRMPAVNFRISD